MAPWFTLTEVHMHSAPDYTYTCMFTQYMTITHTQVFVHSALQITPTHVYVHSAPDYTYTHTCTQYMTDFMYTSICTQCTHKLHLHKYMYTVHDRLHSHKYTYTVHHELHLTQVHSTPQITLTHVCVHSTWWITHTQVFVHSLPQVILITQHFLLMPKSDQPVSPDSLVYTAPATNWLKSTFSQLPVDTSTISLPDYYHSEDNYHHKWWDR
jgi:hypothetical protein